MKKLLPILALCLLAMAPEGPIAYDQLYAEQMEHSCTEVEAIEKRLINMQGKVEIHQFDYDCAAMTATDERGQSYRMSLRSELVYAMQSYFLHPRHAEYFDQAQVGDTLVARVHAGEEDSTPLQLQKLILESGRKPILRYVRSDLYRHNFLYALRVRMEVWFDAEGIYQQHRTWVQTDVSLYDPVETRIEGRRLR